MNTRSVCIRILYVCGSSLLISSVLSCSGKYKGEGWSSGYEFKDYKADFSHLDHLDASAHPTLSEKIRWVLKDHYNKHGKHHQEHKVHHGHSGGGHGSSGYGYGAGGGGHYHHHHEGVAWSPPKHNGPIFIQHGGISHGHSQQSYQEHHNNHHDVAHNNDHHEGDDENGHNEIDHTNNANDNINVHQQHHTQVDNKGHQWSPPAHSYQYAAHNSHLVPLAVRPNSAVGSKDFMLKLRDLLGINKYIKQ